MIASTDIAIADYHASDYVSHSKLRTFAEYGPAGYRARHLVADWRPKTTEAMRFGQAFETFLQDPKRFAELYAEVTDDGDKDALLAEIAALGALQDDGAPYTKRHGVTTLKTAILQAKGGEAMTRAKMIKIERMADAFSRNNDAQTLIRGMTTQVTLRLLTAADVIPGIQSRPDWVDLDDFAPRSTADLKVTGEWGRHDSDGADLDRKLISLGVHTQAALIDMITGPAKRYAIVCEDDFPWRCQVVDLEDLLPAGRQWCERMLGELRTHYAHDVWPACESLREARLPTWMQRKTEESYGW